MGALTPMASIDAAWLAMEDPTNLMMVTGLLVLDGPVDVKRMRGLLDRRLKPFARFHQKVVRPRTRAGLPHWEEDSGFDVDDHVSHLALPAPGGDKELRSLTSELMSSALDFSKPLWHVHVIDGYKGGSVILARIHHCIADGIALVRVMLSLTDATPGARTRAAPRQKPAAGFQVPLDWLPTMLSPDQVLRAARAGAHGAYRLGRLVLLPPDPKTVFRGRLGRRKRAAWSDNLPLEDFKAIGRAYGATVNDVLVAVTAGALRRYMTRRGQKTAGVSMRASVPVNLRPAAETHKLGNAFGLVFLTLPVGISNPVKRLAAIKKEMDELKRSPEALIAFGVLTLLGYAPVEVEQVGLRFFGSKATAVLTNVPGPRQPLYMAGRKVSQVMFWVPQSGHLGLGISILSYDGGVRLGIATDAGLVPDPERIVQMFKAEFESLKKSSLKIGAATS